MTSLQPPAAACNDGPAAMNLAVEAALSNLKPLRDLAQNWDIDIASCLEDYLHELVSLGHPPDPRFPNGHPAGGNGTGTGTGNGTGSSDTNFAQAALLLQNSSSVYSRKVEYLHSLVYQALNDLIASTRNGGKNGSRQGASKRGGTDAILEELTDFDADMEFLLLDDVLPTDDSPDGDRINLRDDGGNIDLLDFDDDDNEGGINNNSNNLSLLAAGGTPKTAAGLNATRLSLGGLSVTRLDRSAMGNNRGVTSEAATRALIGTILNEGSDGQGNLRLLNGKCDVSSTGALLMPGSSLLNAGGGGSNSQGRDSSMMVNPDSSLFVPESAGTDAAAMEEDDGHFAPAGDDDDDDDDGVGFALADDYEDGEEKKDDGMTAMQAPKRVQFAPMPEKKVDPWALLDPHDAGTAKVRPLRIGVTYRLPPGVDDTPSECVTGARTKTRTRPRSTKHKTKKRFAEGLDSFVSVAAYKSSRASVAFALDEGDMDDEEAEKLEALAEVASVSMTGLAYGSEFAYIAKSTAKREAAAKREERRKKQMEEDGLRPSSSSGHDQDAAAFDDDEDEYGGGFDFGGDDDDLDENDEGLTRGNVGVTSLDEAISTATTSGAHFGSGDDSTNLDAETFEELCRAHLRAFARGAEKYAAETQLSRRVGDWQSKLSPILEQEEQRPEFDIHVYGDRIMQTVEDEIDRKKADSGQLKLSAKGSSSPTNVVDFRAVTEDSEDYEVCRLFLSSLMLCNSGNVILSHEHEGAAVASPESLRIELLEGQVERPMETYLAPSVVDQENMVVS